MTSVTVRPGAMKRRWLAVVAGLVTAALFVAGLVESHRSEARVAPRAALVPPQRAAAMVEATSAKASYKAVGDQARLINASIPLDSTPLASARAFAVGGQELDRTRALTCLTQAIYYEAGFEPLAGRRAVAQVVLNRVRHPAFPKSVCGVVYQRNATPICQFSFVCDGSLDRAPAPDAWRAARAIAAASLDGFVEPSVGSATHYHADYVAPYWAPMLTKVATLGRHIFYRWPGTWGLPGAFNGRYIGERLDYLQPRIAVRSLTGKAVELPPSEAAKTAATSVIASGVAGDRLGDTPVSIASTKDIKRTGSATRAIDQPLVNQPTTTATQFVATSPMIASPTINNYTSN